jgi:hypothetical protein
MSEERTLQALRALAENDFGAQASLDLETRVLQEFRSAPLSSLSLADGGGSGCRCVDSRVPAGPSCAKVDQLVSAIPTSAPESFAAAQPSAAPMPVAGPRKINRKPTASRQPEGR